MEGGSSSTTSFGAGVALGVGGAVAAMLAARHGACVAGAVRSRLGLAGGPRFVSTRGFAHAEGGIDFEAAVLMGLAPDGGLFVPTHFPQVSQATLDSWYGLDYASLAFEVLSLYVPRAQISASALRDIVDRSYGTFRHEQVTPVVRTGAEGNGPVVLELFHGATFAFKDVALSFLGNVFEHFISKAGEGKAGEEEEEHVTVLGATSGDTGSSAIYGLRGKKGVDVFILYPEGRVSEIQELQMATVPDDNVHCVAVNGSFDDAQAIVKEMFREPKSRKDFNLGAVNSINFARILAQIVYYMYAYLQVVPKGSGRRASFSVPTGNFGDILAGFYAKQMGLPVDQLVVATNENDILHGFFHKGEYAKPAAVTHTNSPSMDICVSSNFERFLYHMAGSPTELAQLMAGFEESGKIVASKALLAEARSHMTSQRLSQQEVLDTIRTTQAEHGYLLDPHSAIGVGAAAKAKEAGEAGSADSPMVCLACAHWAKFVPAVEEAVGKEVVARAPFPEELQRLRALPMRKTVMPATVSAVDAHMRKTLGM